MGAVFLFGETTLSKKLTLRYTYKLCFFKDAKQSFTRLGTWSGPGPRKAVAAPPRRLGSASAQPRLHFLLGGFVQRWGHVPLGQKAGRKPKACQSPPQRLPRLRRPRAHFEGALRVRRRRGRPPSPPQLNGAPAPCEVSQEVVEVSEPSRCTYQARRARRR